MPGPPSPFIIIIIIAGESLLHFNAFPSSVDGAVAVKVVRIVPSHVEMGTPNYLGSF